MTKEVLWRLEIITFKQNHMAALEGLGDPNKLEGYTGLARRGSEPGLGRGCKRQRPGQGGIGQGTQSPEIRYAS